MLIHAFVTVVLSQVHNFFFETIKICLTMCQVEEEYHNFGLIGQNSMSIPINPSETFCMYIPSQVYNDDVSIGQKTVNDLQRQLRMDLHRSVVHVNGERIKAFDDIPVNIDNRILKYMTQNVMALPLTCLQSSTLYPVCEIYENPRILSIELWGKTLKAKKDLCIPLNNKHYIIVTITVYIDLNDDLFIIECIFSEEKRSSMSFFE